MWLPAVPTSLGSLRHVRSALPGEVGQALRVGAGAEGRRRPDPKQTRGLFTLGHGMHISKAAPTSQPPCMFLEASTKQMFGSARLHVGWKLQQAGPGDGGPWVGRGQGIWEGGPIHSGAFPGTAHHQLPVLVTPDLQGLQPRRAGLPGRHP